MSQFYGTAGKLETPITIDSVEYTHFVRFDNAPDGVASDATLVVSGTLSSWSRAAGVVTGVVARQRVVGAILNAENQEIEQFYYIGGNVGPTIEPQRFYSKQSPSTSVRGGKRSGQVGDVVKFPGVADWHRQKWPLTEVEAYAVSSVPRWQQGEAPRAVYVLTPNMNPDAVLSESTTERVRWYSGPATGDAGVGMFDLTSFEYEPSARIIFADDESYYPPDATFPGSDAHGEYWIDPTLTAVTFASQNEGLSGVLGDACELVWYVEVDEVAEDADRIVVEADEGGAGYGDLDEVVLATRYMDGNFTKYVDFTRLSDGSWPEFSFEVRGALNSEAEAVGFDVVGGEITQYRQKSGGVWTVTPITPIALDASDPLFRITTQRSGASIQFLISGASITSTSIHTFNSLTMGDGVWMSVVVFDEQAVPFEIGFGAESAVTWFLHSLSPKATGALLERNSKEITANFTQTFDLQDPNEEPIEEVYNLTAGTVMTASATPARDHYTTSAGQITFYAESDRDQIRITHEASDPGDPDAVGIAPVQNFPNTLNMATADDGTAAANHAYWQDRIRFPDPDELFNGAQNEAFEIHREGCWDPGALPTLHYSYKGNSSATWTAVGSNALALPGPKVFLLAGSWVAGLSEPLSRLCFQMRGTRVLAQPSLNGDRQINVLTRALGSLVDCWMRVDFTGGGGFGVRGISAMHVGPSAFECHDGTCWRPTAYVFGTPPNSMPAPAQWPYEQTGAIRYRTQDYSVDNTILNCGASTRVVGEAYVDGLTFVEVAFNNEFPNYFGSGVTGGGNGVTAGFDLAAVSCGIPRPIRKLPIEILEAYSIVDFSSLVGYYGTFTHESESSNVGIVGNIRWQLLGIRRRRRTIRDGGGNPTTIREIQWKTYGASMVGSAANGPEVYDSKDLLDAMLVARGDEWPEHVLMPSVGLTGGSAESLKGYVLSQFPSGLSAEVGTVDGCDVTPEWSVDWRRFEYAAVSIHSTLARVRVPSGLLANRAFPLVRPSLVPY